jgi:flavin-dependent thymidylate synthase
VRVTLFEYTGRPDPWRAADILLYTKSTRLRMSPDGIDAIAAWPEAKKMEELAYAANTIRSSWEMVAYFFLLEDVTRAFTHQLVRTRHASYAQQTQQILKIDADNVEPPRGDLNSAVLNRWGIAVRGMARMYNGMMDDGATVEQARGILPTNIRTNIVVKMNLRTLVEVFGQRISPRNLSEYSEVARAMRAAVLAVHPWTTLFLEQSTDKYLEELDAILKELRDAPSGYNVPGEATRAMKLVDQIRRNKPTMDGDEP